jgi:peptidoglycan-associated lipoprotein
VKRNGLSVVGTIFACVLVAGLAGCKGKKDKPMITTDLNANDSSSIGGEGRGGEGLPDDIDMEVLLFNPDRGLQLVYFDYDSYELRADALATLRTNAEKLRQAPNAIIQIEGHCDERGTQEYNLALGEKRALAVRSHLMNLGISGDRMITISYGEEDPVAYGSGESAWSQNRRAEFNRAM